MSCEYLSFIYLLIAKLLCFYHLIDSNEIAPDYFPNSLDKRIDRKLVYYISHLTNTSSLILTMYFMLKLLYYQYDDLFILISPISLSVNFNYFMILYPHKNQKLYELNYYSIITHLMTTFIIQCELYNINYKNIYQCFYFFIYMIIAMFINLFNYYYRGIWTYGICDMYRFRGWLLFIIFSTTSTFFSLGLYYYNNYLNNKDILY